MPHTTPKLSPEVRATILHLADQAQYDPDTGQHFYTGSLVGFLIQRFPDYDGNYGLLRWKIFRELEKRGWVARPGGRNSRLILKFSLTIKRRD